MRRGGSHENYTNPCLTMHQPWASLLVHGIKRIEGRSWPAPIRGRLWIHAASKVPEEATIKLMEDFYKEIYAEHDISLVAFPDHYPVSRLLGCIEVVGCLKCEELASWEAIPKGVRLEGQTDFCWLCEKPKKLLVPFEMRGRQGVYNLEKKIFEAAVRGLTLVKSPMPVTFPLPDPLDQFSLKPGSVATPFSHTKTSHLEIPCGRRLAAAIAGARAATTQFNKKDQGLQNSDAYNFTRNLPRDEVLYCAGLSPANTPGTSCIESSKRPIFVGGKPFSGPTAKIFAAAVKQLSPV